MGFKYFLSYITPHRSVLILAVVFMLGETAVSLSVPWIAGHFAAGVIGQQAAFALSQGEILALLLVVFILQAFFRFSNSYLVTLSGARILASLSVRLYDHIQSLPVSYFHDKKRGQVLALLSNDVSVLSHFVTGTLAGLVPMLLTLVGAIVLMALINWEIALLVFLLTPFFYLSLKLMGRKIRPISTNLMQKQADTVAVLDENLGLFPLIKAFVRESVESQRFESSIFHVFYLRQQQLRLQAVLGPVIQLLASLGVLAVLWLSSQYLQAGKLTAPELVSLLFYGLLFSRPVSGLANLYGDIQQARGGAERLLDIFSVLPEPVDDKLVELPIVTGEIDFCDIHFGYPDGRPLFEGLNLHIDAGETVAITGVNGEGKSTLAHLLMRFFDPVSGTVELDGIDLQTVNLASIRRQIGLVSQHVLLLDSSVAENIAYGKPGASAAEIETAARAANAHEFIVSLSSGYHTMIGEQGVRLSGGQRQRLALARALLVEPAILILDEATSMFDPKGEEVFIHESHKQLRSRTVILITHSPASLALADRVMRLENGQMIEVMK
ncbi:Lipid A export ATP-binding/permease protein MsbA [hydrothermal vent metagenome]|uniref:Lipid A export ATP-binding/permease protein MsbA n=1 Tax=hydrothermal vent metagenome TaxID=652676 RepID=A0A3B0Z0I0_9ZZZZ